MWDEKKVEETAGEVGQEMKGMGEKMGTMAKKKLGATCPCGFTFTTPHGEDDAVAVLQNHVSRIHPKDYPNGMTREVALKEIKEIM